MIGQNWQGVFMSEVKLAWCVCDRSNRQRVFVTGQNWQGVFVTGQNWQGVFVTGQIGKMCL